MTPRPPRYVTRYAGPLEPLTPVVFRVWRAKPGGVLALFPTVAHNRDLCSSYEHVGQHGGADYTGCIRLTRPATPDEIRPLAAELTACGYRLQIVTRKPSKGPRL